MQIDDLIKFVRIETPGAMDEIIVQCFAAAAKEFCTRTNAWTEIQAPVALVDNTAKYTIAPPADASFLSVLNVWSATKELIPKTMAEVAILMPNWQDAKGPVPMYFNMASDWSALTVFPTPLNALGAPLTFKAKFAPKFTATTLPDFLVDQHFDALVAGAKQRMFAQINVPWSNLATSGLHKGIFDNEVANARITEIHDRVPSAITVKPRRFI